MFGRLEEVGQFESQAGKYRKPLPPEEPAVMNRGVKLFTDREYVIDEMPGPVRGLPFLRTSIEKLDAEVTRPGTLYALTPTIRPQAASQEAALQKAGFTKVDVPEVQLFPGEINRVSLYRKDVKPGERLRFSKMVLLIMGQGAEVRLVGAAAALAPVDARTEPPVIITEPGRSFRTTRDRRDDHRHGSHAQGPHLGLLDRHRRQEGRVLHPGHQR